MNGAACGLALSRKRRLELLQRQARVHTCEVARFRPGGDVRYDLEDHAEVLQDGVVADAETELKVGADAGDDQRVREARRRAEVVDAAEGGRVLRAENVG